MDQATYHAFLVQLAQESGVATEFWDWQGNAVTVSDKTLQQVLAALDIDAATEESCQEALAVKERKKWEQLAPAVVVTEEHHERTIDIHVVAGAPAQVTATLEDGRIWSLLQAENNKPHQEYGGCWYAEASFVIPADMPLGYHRLKVVSNERLAEVSLIVTPTWLGMPAQIGQQRVWGYATQFYSARSQHSWGIGDFSDLADIATWAGTTHDASYVLINPVHASNPVSPLEPSPYLPTSRRYVNPLYIRVEDIPEYAALPAVDRAEIAKIHDELMAELDPQHLNRNLVWEAKIKALRIVFAAGLRPARRMAFDEFCRREGQELAQFAVWSVLHVEYGPQWREWPRELQRPSSPAVADFARNHAGDVDFFAWLQWIVDTQRAQAQLSAKLAGMPLGIINDLAVGISGDGAEAWALADVFAQGVQVGAPADAFNQAGQDWGQPPWRPDRLAELGYAPFRSMVAGMLRHSGGIRVDHIIGLFRLWWVPVGSSPNEGTYVRYDHDALIGILALEAYRARALVIGEDLGTFEPWVRDYLRRRGLLGTSILWFEQDVSGSPIPPEQWRDYAMTSVTTHDLPPTAGYLAGDHVKLRAELGLLAVPEAQEMARSREEQQRWIEQLIARGYLAADLINNTEEVVLALHRYIAATPSRVLCVSLVDVVGDSRTQNQPGTCDEYPNWRIPLSDAEGIPVTLEQIYQSSRAMRLAAVMNESIKLP
ncbi:MAG: 4-alpha-glucanotransferase [Propionibacteriaceae bacterium]